MIPIVSVGNLISFIASFLSAIKLRSAYLKTKNIEVGYFFGSVAFIALYFFDISLPGLVINDVYILGFTNAISLPIALISCLFFAIIPLELMGLEKFKKLYILIILLVVAVILVLRTMAFSPLIRQEAENFVYFLRPVDSRIKIAHLLGGITILISLLLSGGSFLLHGLRHRKEKYVFRRSLLLGGGATLMAAAAAVNYILGSTPQVYSLLGGSFLAVIAIILILAGVLYKSDRKLTQDN